MATPSGYSWFGEPSRTNVAPKLQSSRHPKSATGGNWAPRAAPSLPGNVKRAVSRDGLGRQTSATVCLESQTDKLFDAAAVDRLTSKACIALGVPKWNSLVNEVRWMINAIENSHLLSGGFAL